MPYNQQAADERHRRRRDWLQEMRNEMSDLLNYYYESFPESREGESELEYKIEERLVRLQREMDSFMREFKNLPNE